MQDGKVKGVFTTLVDAERAAFYFLPRNIRLIYPTDYSIHRIVSPLADAT